MIQGVLPVVQTPFRPDGELDLDSLRREARYICDTGADGMVYPGFVSEWWKLSDSEVMCAAKAIREETRGRAMLILNLTAQSTHLAVRQAREFAALGCDALMSLPPFVVEPSPGGALAHIEAVLEATPLPLVLQYSASLTGLSLEPEQLLGLRRRFANIVSIKVDFIPPAPTVSALVEALGTEGLTYLVGYAGLQLPDCLARGAHGLMGGAGHLEEDVAVFAALRANPRAGREAFCRLLPLLNFEMQTVGTSIALHKQLLYDRGVIACPLVRQPGRAFDARDLEELRAVAACARGCLKTTA